MANYFVINNKFKPYSFDELIRPYQMYGEAYKEQEALLDTAAAKEFSPDYLDQNLDSAAYNMYNNATIGLKNASDELASKGLSAGLKSRLKSTARDYNRTMTALNDAQERLNAERDRRAKLGDDYVYQQDDLRIGDFLNGATPNLKGESLSNITKNIAAEFGARAKGITDETWNKLFSGNGRVISGYYDVKTETGLKNAQLDTILSSDAEWNAMMSNPTIPREQKELLKGFRDTITRSKNSMGYDSYNPFYQGKINEAIAVGAHAGLGTTAHEAKVDRSYNPELFYRMERDRIEDEDKAEQKAKSRGELPFYTDPDGNQWFSDGTLVWEHDKEGKQVLPPTPKSKLQDDSGTVIDKKTQAEIEGVIKANRNEEFPLYMQDKTPGWFTKNDKEKAKKDGAGDYNDREEKPVSLEDFGEARKSKLRDILNEINTAYNTNITLGDVRIYKDPDVFTNEYKILLNGAEIGTMGANNKVTVVPSAISDSTAVPRSSISMTTIPGAE